MKALFFEGTKMYFCPWDFKNIVGDVTMHLSNFSKEHTV